MRIVYIEAPPHSITAFTYWEGATLAKQWLDCPVPQYTQLDIGFWNNWGMQYYDDRALIEL